LLFYTDRSKKGNKNVASICQVGAGQRILHATNFNLGLYIEIMDAELFAIYKALQHVEAKCIRNKEVWIFVDSQATIKYLQSYTLGGGQHIRQRFLFSVLLYKVRVIKSLFSGFLDIRRCLGMSLQIS
jgi:ribonuclease HI